jgi:hypothetical protein
MAGLLNLEQTDSREFTTGVIEHMSQGAMPVTPEMVSVREAWKKSTVLQVGTVPALAPDAPAPIVAPDESTSSSSGVEHYDSVATWEPIYASTSTTQGIPLRTAPLTVTETPTTDVPMRPTQETTAPTADDAAMQLQQAFDNGPPAPPIAGLPVPGTEPVALTPSGTRSPPRRVHDQATNCGCEPSPRGRGSGGGRTCCRTPQRI